MADTSEIISALNKLSAYYGKEPTKAQVRFYLEELTELEPAALEYAIQAWIRSSPFFPRISELLKSASHYTPQPVPTYRTLFQVQWNLEWKFFHEGILEMDEWENLAHSFELNNRIYSANACRKRARGYQEILDLEKSSSKMDRMASQ